MATLSAVEFALCVLCMFGQIIDENRMAVHVLLEAIKSYNPLTGQFGKRAVKQVGYGGRSSLRALAAYLGKDYTMKELRTEDGAQAVLHTILDPVIGCLTRTELGRMRKDIDKGIELASSAPVEEVRARVSSFMAKAWADGRREHWMGVWKDRMKGKAIEARDDQPSTAVDLPSTQSTRDLAIVPVASTLKRRVRVPINRRSTWFPRPVDVCLGRSLSTSGECSDDTTPRWNPRGWKAMYRAATSREKLESPVDFKFPPPGMVAWTKSSTPSTGTVVDPEQAREMWTQLKRWEDEWEKEQLGSWKSAIEQDNALCFIVEYIRDKRIWHPHGWKKFDGTAWSAHKNTGFRFPAAGSTVRPRTLVEAGSVDSNGQGSSDVDAKYRRWEDSWEAEQLGKWCDGLKMRVTRAEGGLWKRLAMAWKWEGVDLWTGMVEDVKEVDEVDEGKSTSLATKLGRVFGLA